MSWNNDKGDAPVHCPEWGTQEGIQTEVLVNPFRSIPDFLILLCLTPADFTLVTPRRFYSSKGEVSDMKGLKSGIQ